MLEAQSGKVTVFLEETVTDWSRRFTQKTLSEQLKQYPDEKVLFFPENRVLTVDTEIIREIMEAEKLMGTMSNIDTYLTRAEKQFDLSDPYVFRDKKKGDKLTSGYMQIMNFLYTIRFYAENDCIIGIEFPEDNLHECLRVPIISALASMQKVKKLYLSTRSESIYKAVLREHL